MSQILLSEFLKAKTWGSKASRFLGTVKGMGNLLNSADSVSKEMPGLGNRRMEASGWPAEGEGRQEKRGRGVSGTYTSLWLQ